MIDKLGAYFLSKLDPQAELQSYKCDKQIDLVKKLGRTKNNFLEFRVRIGKKSGNLTACRVICLRVDAKTAKKRREKLRKNRKSHGLQGQPKKRSLFLCNWTILITNAPKEKLPARCALNSYRLRWQIELVFKQFKSVMQIHSSNVINNQWRLRCEILGKLIVAILTLRIYAIQNTLHWNKNQIQISMDKLWKRIQERSFSILKLLLINRSQAIRFLENQIAQFIDNCTILKQKSRKNAFTLIDQSW